jgi:broad specificity phosphatase PhoE
MSESQKHLVLIRHGKSEADLRREAWARGEDFETDKKPEEEELAPRGEEESSRGGLWVTKNIIRKCGLLAFDGCYVSSALRSEQSATAMSLDIAVWQEDHALDARNRGSVRGLRAEEHQQRFPESYAEMHTAPLAWVPPGGESIMEVSGRVSQFLDNIQGLKTVLAVTHRDWMWAAMAPLEGLSKEELLAVNTDEIHNAQIHWYTSIDPDSGKDAHDLLWKLSVDPMQPEETTGWQFLSKKALH